MRTNFASLVAVFVVLILTSSSCSAVPMLKAQSEHHDAVMKSMKAFNMTFDVGGLDKHVGCVYDMYCLSRNRHLLFLPIYMFRRRGYGTVMDSNDKNACLSVSDKGKSDEKIVALIFSWNIKSKVGNITLMLFFVFA